MVTTAVPLTLSAQEIPQKFVRPPRFVPPVHAQPLQEVKQTSVPTRSLRTVQQVAAVQEFDLPPAQTDGSGSQAGVQQVPADQWQSRQTSPSANEAWQEQSGLDSSTLQFDSSDAPPQVPSPIGNDEGWYDKQEKSVLVRSPEHSSPVSGDGNRLRQIQNEPNRISAEHTSPAGFRNPPAAFRQETDQIDPDVARGRTTCDEFRNELLNTPITDIILDISPLRPQTNEATQQELTRTWSDCHGNALGVGKLTGLERGYVVIANEAGVDQRIAMQLLSDGDRAVVTSWWGLPTECSLGCDTFEGRAWNPNTMHWNASALCHKPLYFENIQLERYGHTHGPIVQPFHSAAHFFVSLISVPYQTGIHPANECIYSLGYYRPGDCAPWLKDPIPLSLNGAVRQTAVVAGAAAIFP